MSRIVYSLFAVLLLASCGAGSRQFKIDGHLLNLNQGEFYVYSTDGAISEIDTIKVEGGRFAYSTPCTKAGTLMIVFPNYSELPVIAEPGKTVTIDGDAQHLKELEVKGTKENKLLTAFRQQIAKESPPEVRRLAAKFVEDNAETLAAVYVLRRYFITDPTATDRRQTEQLVNTVNKAQPKNGNVARMALYLRTLKNGTVGAQLPHFTTTDIKGRAVSDASLRGKPTVVIAWATWSWDSRAQADRIRQLLSQNRGKFNLLTINLDASAADCRRTLTSDSTATVNICDQLMFDSPLMQQFALRTVPDNVVFNAQGRITDRSLSTDELERRLKSLLMINE